MRIKKTIQLIRGVNLAILAKRERKAIFMVIATGTLLLFWFPFDAKSISNPPEISKTYTGSPGPAALAKYADYIVSKCREESFTPTCYDNEIPKLMGFISMEDAFKVTWLVQAKDDKYLYCHVLGHNLSYRETGRNLAAWKDILTRCPTTKCNNGCLHGSLMKRFNNEYLTEKQIEQLIPDLKDVCEPRGNWHPQGIEISMCYHALGHLAMYVTKADVPKSIAICQKIGKKEDGRDYVRTCTEGVFMQIYQPLEPEDYALVRGMTPEKNEVASFCEKYKNSGEYSYQACNRESWPLFRAEQETPDGLMKFCSFAESKTDLRVCESSVLSHITTDFMVAQKNPERMRKYCLGLPKERDSQCFGDVAMRLIQLDPVLTDQAVSICNMAKDAGIGELCFNQLLFYSTFSFHTGTPEFINYCNRLPGDWKTKCLKGER